MDPIADAMLLVDLQLTPLSSIAKTISTDKKAVTSIDPINNIHNLGPIS